MCEGCLITEKEKQALINSVQQKAQVYANEIKKLVILYETSEGVPAYMEAEAARLAGVRILGYIPNL
jgi:hypothetical protein